ncbi:Uu.00g025050.m01.CDS01 [Anthostomella pinea]|uniref:Uu.00g025050.m01.CDS01 n=1 Tax=Anthostomella pinea TaxID=933095 RepID=A0AAI8YCG7_9PEZI|nr:Uu.00g025050.m01.CDS01 [Anthostomella pinea]
MSGRSAYVRKKITEPKPGDRGSSAVRGRAKSAGSSRFPERDDVSVNEYPLPQGTGYGTTNARFLKFSEPARDNRETDSAIYRTENTNFSSNNSSGSQSGGSDAGRRDAGTPGTPRGPMPDFAYARARKPVLKTEDVSGIERSGFRSAVDKKSDGFRKGLTKAFTFGGKKKKGGDVAFRSPSSATIRPYSDVENMDANELFPMPVPNPQSGTWDPEYQQMVSPPPSAKLPPLPPPAITPPTKRWIGAGRPVQRWNKLRKDPELWDPNGDVLVYFGRKGQLQRPHPSFRLSSHIIEATESRFLVTLLREGSTDDDYDTQADMPPSPVGAPPMVQHSQLGYNLGRAGQPTPPVSEDASLTDTDGQISYEIYLPTPPNLTKLEAHRHAITTRNVFALLYHASLVGLSLFQALSDLLARLDGYMPSEADNVGTILNYLSARRIDDARNDAETAVSMLAWSETPEVRWEEGWREAFLHCAGMYSLLESCADFRHVTPITRALLERACLETQLRVQAAEERLAEFAYGDIWPVTGPIAHSASRAAADRLQQFFRSHYARIHGSWPPPETDARTTEGEEMWLTRTMARKMQRDFGALYDYLVNRDVVWDESETRSSRKWMMVSESGNKSFSADKPDLPLTDMLIEFDNRMRFPHIPHPYPLVPESIPPTNTPGSGSGRERLRKDRSAKQGGDGRTLERRVHLAYTEATNIYALGSDFAQSALVENFVKFEKADQIGALDPFCARRGRWVLIYGILQTLAIVSVDSPNVRYKDNVSYHLSPRLKGTKTPPWKGVSMPAQEACHELSHCWTAPHSWHSGSGSAESDTSVSSSTRDPLSRMMRSHVQGFQRAPQPFGSQSSNAGWYALGIQSSGIAAPPTPTTWGGSSTVSVSTYSEDTASSVRTPTSAQYPSQTYPSQMSYKSTRSRGGGGDGGAKSERSFATFGANDGRADEGPWPPRSQSIHRAKPPGPLDLAQGMTGVDDFLDVSHSPSSPDVKGEATMLGNSGSSDGTGPLIRDFDELDPVAE